MENLNHTPEISLNLFIWQILLQSKSHHLKGCDSLISQLKANYFHGNSVQMLTSGIGDIVFNIFSIITSQMPLKMKNMVKTAILAL